MTQPALPATALTGFHDAQHYDAHRPSYPPSAVAALLTHLSLRGVPGAHVVEIGAGTGKFTACLAEREEGYRVVAVEPHARMRDELVVKVRRGEMGGVVVREGDSENLGDGEGVEGVVVAQVGWVFSIYIPSWFGEGGWADFEWVVGCRRFIGKRVTQVYVGRLSVLTHLRFANEATLKEIHRVLPVGGGLGMIWNVEDYNQPRGWKTTTDWEQKLKDIIWSLDDGMPRFRHEKYKQCFENQALMDPLFSLPLGEESIPWVSWLTPEGVWDRFSTLSQIALLEHGRKTSLKQQVFDLIAGGDVERNEKEEVALHGVTFLSWTSKVG
ncbi:MAG: hypothetical protein M1833_000997 [Piccolia ochrophora]|nr:MAG: hypothetical protein M1833_000997 [Piccolia ochrophora]